MKIPTRDELVAMLEGISPREPFGQRDRAVIVLLANTGLRVSELAGLDVVDVVGNGQIRDEVDILRRWSKGRHSRIVPLNAAARKAIAVILRFNLARGFSVNANSPLVQDRWHRRVPVRSLQRMMQKYRERVQASRLLTPHSLRHYFADRALHRGAKQRAISVALGHKRLETLEVYTRATREDLREVVGD